MNIVIKLLVIAIALLSIAAGIAKVIQSPQELKFLSSLGFNAAMITVYGIMQIVGGALLFSERTRLSGAVIVTISFLISSALIIASGNLVFGMVSLLPVVLAAFIIKQNHLGEFKNQ